MQLTDILQPVAGLMSDTPLPEVEVRDVSVSSKRVRPGSLFVAMRGAVSDGHLFVEEAIQRGAVAIVGDRHDAQWWQRLRARHPGLACIQLQDVRGALVHMGQQFYQHPTQRLQLVGITGTNGKTTTSYVIEQLLGANGTPTGVLGTVSYRYGNRHIPSTNTTPGQLELQALFAQMVQQRISWCVMEVSSHALHQRRVEGLEFTSAIFTNLSADHLDYHRSKKAYFEAKCRLFDQMTPAGRAVINIDDPAGRQLVQRLRVKNGHGPQLVTYGLSATADFSASNWHTTWSGSTFDLQTPRGTVTVSTPLLGLHNIMNIVSAAAAVYDRPCPLDVLEHGIGMLAGVPGRMERMSGGQEFHVVVDYAHTEAALEAAMLTVRSLQPQRVLLVFGCGGNRDRSKRPAMGRVAGRLADRVYITSDNPRSEDPVDIAAHIEMGVGETHTPYEIIPDRAAAICTALDAAQPGDCVLIAGKGHEAYQMLRDTTIPFDDRHVVRRWMANHMVLS
jgi:UDP-N-acetylmuramoyl-L-alanyl-D-glutamate--2,6-diaminopimelate ligase